MAFNIHAMKKCFLLPILALLAYSCSNDTTATADSFTTQEWKKTAYHTDYYYDGVFDTTRIDTVNKNIESLKFNDDQTVVYHYPVFIAPINGTWNYDNTTQDLNTTLKIEMSGATGFGTRYFFPHTRRIQMTDELLELQSDTTYTAFFSGGAMITGAQVTHYYFHH